MPKLTSTPRIRANAPVRDRGDACPGALRLHSADDGALARIRIPAGALTVPQALVLADAAEGLGDGRIDITSRGNLQLRGLPEDCGAQLASALEESGLLPSPRHERVRNIVASPLSGLDGGEADVRPWAAELDALVCASDAAVGLSGRFLFALDDGRGDVAALGADVTLVALPGGEALLRIGTESGGVRVGAEAAPRTALLAAEMFLTVAEESGTRAWRVGELPDGGEAFTARIAELSHVSPVSDPSSLSAPSRCGTGRPAPGVVEGPGGRCALSVLAPLGRLTAGQWRGLASAAGREGGTAGAGELRVTPWRGVVVAGVPRGSAAERMRGLDEAGLITHAGSPWLDVGACTGLPGCARSHRDVRSDAAAALGTEAAGRDSLPVHWSGCERRCGHPQGDRVDVVAGESGYTVAVRVADSTEQDRDAAEPAVQQPVRDGDLAGAVASARATAPAPTTTSARTTTATR